MVLLEKYRTGKLSQVQVVSVHATVLFDCQAPLYGKNHRLPSFKEHASHTKFVVRNFSDLDCVFVSSSLSFGVFFLRCAKIYMTEPVYEQLLLRYEEYRDMPTVYDELAPEDVCQEYFDESLSSDEYDVVPLDLVDIKEFSKHVVIVKYNQVVCIGSLRVQPLPSGTFIGWCNYRMEFDNGETVMLLFSYSARRRFSTEAPPIDTDYLLICRSEVEPENQVSDFSGFITDYVKGSSRRILVVPTDLETLFIEVIFHVLSLVEDEGVQVTIVSPIFRKLDLLLNIQNEWLNRNLLNISEPFPLKKYRNLCVLSSIFDIRDGEKNIVFCGHRYWELLRHRSMFRDSETVYINCESGHGALPDADEGVKRFRPCQSNEECLPGIAYKCDGIERSWVRERAFKLKMESIDEEILSGYKGRVLHTPEYLHSERPTCTILVDSRLPVLNGRLLLTGTLVITDFDDPGRVAMTLEDRPCFLREILENDVPVSVDGWFYCRNSRIKFRLRGSDQIEYSHF